ncbi:MAG: tetratricopeptide repeat protein [Bacteroidia bacterium]|jgi:Tfp pilus assembly protein PilF
MSNIRLQKLAEMLEKQPNDTFLIYAMGMEYLGTGDLNVAEKYFKQVLEVDPLHVATHYQLGILFTQTNRENEAQTFLEKGFELAKQKGDLKTQNEFRSALDELLY